MLDKEKTWMFEVKILPVLWTDSKMEEWRDKWMVAGKETHFCLHATVAGWSQNSPAALTLLAVHKLLR